MIYDRGETVPRSIEIRDSLGALYDPDTSIKITISSTNPTVVVVAAQDMVKDSTGVYHYNWLSLITSVLGTYLVTYVTVDSFSGTTIQYDQFGLANISLSSPYTTRADARIELSKQLGDYWTSTTTGNGAAGGTTIVDSALMAKNNDWVDADNAEMHDLILSGAYVNEERRATALVNSTGTLTVLAHGGQIVSGVTYEIHRMFTPSEKSRALDYACRKAFPAIFKWVKDTSLEVGTDYKADLSALGLANNRPHAVRVCPDKTATMPIWTPVHDWILETDGSIYLPFVPIGWDLQIEGIGFLEFSSSAWSGTIDIAQPQLDILIAQAAIYLCSQKTLPQFTTDQNSQWSNASQMWGQELDSRISKYKMIAPPTTVRW